MAGRLPPRSIACASLAALVAACGRVEPRHAGRTVPELVAGLGGEPDVAREAEAALVEVARTSPEPVLRELERALLAEATSTEVVGFGLALDLDAAAREGLPPMPPHEAVSLDLGPVRNRASALGEEVSLRARREGVVEVAARARPPDELARLQRVLSARGAFELALVVHDDPRKPGLLYDGPVPLATLRATDAARFSAARAAGAPYEPSDRRWRAVPRIGTGAASPEDFEVVRSPRTPEETFTEEALSEVSLAADVATGEKMVVAAVRAPRHAHLRALTTPHVGGRMAVVLDGTAVAVVTLAEPLGERFAFPFPKELADLGREGFAAVLVGRRLPRPLRPVPLPPGAGEARSPETPLARAFVSLGERAVPALERLRDGDAPPRAKAQAVWALERIRGSAGPTR